MTTKAQATLTSLSADGAGRLAARLILKSEPAPDTGCIIWRGEQSHDGYGTLMVSEGGEKTRVKAHRAAYYVTVGNLPDGLHLDHLCRNKLCINAAHLEPVTQIENARRRAFFETVIAPRSHCMKGHPFTAENSYRDAAGNRYCRACRAATSAKRGTRAHGPKYEAARAARIAGEGSRDAP